MWKPRCLLVGLLVLGVSLTACGGGGGGGGDSTLTIENDSDFVLTEVQIAAIDDPTWSGNLLSDVLFPGESLTVVDIDCGTYDVMVVDETGVECVLTDLDLCFTDGVWSVDNFMLDTCAFGP
jgi:hypothetical protein